MLFTHIGAAQTRCARALLENIWRTALAAADAAERANVDVLALSSTFDDQRTETREVVFRGASAQNPTIRPNLCNWSRCGVRFLATSFLVRKFQRMGLAECHQSGVYCRPLGALSSSLDESHKPMKNLRPFLSSSSVFAIALASASVSFACKSELDGKQAAKVGPAATEPKKADDHAAKAEPGEKPADVAKADVAAGAGAAKELQLDASSSSVGFVGAKITGDHKGDFATLSGKCSLVDGKLSAVSVEVDLASVKSDAEKLTGHLKSPDFFDVEKFPKATFTSTSLEANANDGKTHTINGELDLHGVKKPISFAANVNVTDGQVKGTAEFTINRKDFNIVYPGKPDDLIKDDVLLKLDLTCKS
jgi:polyisoprenoid-binding protein YceI